MARYTGPRVRISRRFGIPIFGPSKYLERRNYGPGVHGPKSRRKTTEYGLGLIEKQKLRYYYGLMERQFRGVYEKALRRRGVTGEQMLQILETRLDNVVYQLGLANTRAGARQMVNHGHIKVNGRKVSIASYALRVNDAVEVRDNTRARQMATKNLESSTSRMVPDWLLLNREAFKGVVMRIPSRNEIQPIANEQAVVEYGRQVKRAMTYKGLNRLIQGSAADQTKAAMIALHEAGFNLLLQVHDEIALSVKTRDEARAAADIMETAVKLVVPSRVDVEIGPSWGEAV